MVTASRSGGCWESSPRSRGTFLDVQRHLLSVPDRPSSGTPTAGFHWSHGPHHRRRPTMLVMRSRDQRAGHDGACKQRGRGDKRVFVSDDGDGSAGPQPVSRDLFEKRKREEEEEGREEQDPFLEVVSWSLLRDATIHKSDRSANNALINRD